MANSVEKKDIGGRRLASYTQCDYSYVAATGGSGSGWTYHRSHGITLSECANIFHYCQEVFEGLAYHSLWRYCLLRLMPQCSAYG